MKNIVQVKTDNGNIITDRGRFDLYEADEKDIPTKPFESFRQPGIKIFDNRKREYKKVEPDVSLNIFEKAKAVYYHTKEEYKSKMLDAIKKIITKKLVQWLLGIAGTYFASVGINQSSIEEIVGGVVALVLAIVWSLITTGKIALTDPKEFQKLK